MVAGLYLLLRQSTSHQSACLRRSRCISRSAMPPALVTAQLQLRGSRKVHSLISPVYLLLKCHPRVPSGCFMSTYFCMCSYPPAAIYKNGRQLAQEKGRELTHMTYICYDGVSWHPKLASKSRSCMHAPPDHPSCMPHLIIPEYKERCTCVCGCRELADGGLTAGRVVVMVYVGAGVTH